MIALALAAALTMTPAACAETEPVKDAALNALIRRLGNPLIYGGYGETPADLNRDTARVAAVRKRVETIKDQCSRLAYLDWLREYDREISNGWTYWREQQSALHVHLDAIP